MFDSVIFMVLSHIVYGHVPYYFVDLSHKPHGLIPYYYRSCPISFYGLVPYFSMDLSHTTHGLCHAPQVAPLGHIWSHRRPYRNFRFPVFPIILGIPGPKWIRWVWAKLLFIEGAILNAFYPLVFYETFTLVPFRSFVPVLQIYMYLVLLTW